MSPAKPGSTNPNSLHTFAFPGPEDITRVVLDNGIVLLSRSNYNSPSVVINGYIRVGSIFDPEEMVGIGNFAADALLYGTENRNYYQIFDALESIGAGLGFSGSVHTTTFNGRCLAEDLPLELEILGDALQHPVFPPQQVEQIRAQILTSLAIRAQDTADMAGLAFDEIVYQGHPYSKPAEGYPETVTRVQVDDLQEYHSQNYGPKGMVLAVVGAVGPEQVVELVTQYLGEWVNPQQAAAPEMPPVRPLEKASRTRVQIPGKSQSDILIGAAGPARTAPDYFAAALGNNVLGEFGMMGRIGESLREKAGLAYYASSHLSGGIGPGPWLVSAGVDPHNEDIAIRLIQDEIERFAREPVAESELLDSQSQYIGSLPLSLESNSGVSAALVSLERYNLGLDYFYQFANLIQQVSTLDVLNAARRYLDPDRLAIAIGGP